MKQRTLSAIGCTVVALVACGGGREGSGSGFGPMLSPDGSSAASGTTTSAGVSSSAFQDVDSFIAFVRGLTTDDTSEPLTLPSGPAPASDTAEPAG